MKIFKALRVAGLMATLGMGYAFADGCQSAPGDCSNPNISASEVYVCSSGGAITYMEIHWCNGDLSIYDYVNGTFKHKFAEQQN